MPPVLPPPAPKSKRSFVGSPGTAGMRAGSKTPDVMCPAPRLGMRATENVPDVILAAARLGMRLAMNVPDVT